MKGYHYTSLNNWKSIKKNGLTPYIIRKTGGHKSLGDYFKKPIKGLWIWKNKLPKEDELGTLIWQLTTKLDYKSVKLQVEFDKKDILYWADRRVVVYHTGTFNGYEFHPSEPPAVIVTKIIPPERIKLLRIYDLMDIIK